MFITIIFINAEIYGSDKISEISFNEQLATAKWLKLQLICYFKI